VYRAGNDVTANRISLQEPYIQPDVDGLRQRQLVSPLRRYLSIFSRSPSFGARHQRQGPDRGVSAEENATSAAGTKTVKRQDNDDNGGEMARDPDNGSDDVPCPDRSPMSTEPRPCATGNRGIGNDTWLDSTADGIKSVPDVGRNVNDAKYSADGTTAQCPAKARGGQCCCTVALAADQEASKLSVKRLANHIFSKYRFFIFHK
jgi:hypothetical protein